MNGIEILGLIVATLALIFGAVAWALDISNKLARIETLLGVITGDVVEHDERLQALECNPRKQTRPSPG